MQPWAVACAALSVLLAPAVPTAIATFLAFGVNALASRFRHANLVYIVISLIAFTALVVVLYGFSRSPREWTATRHEQLAGGLAAMSSLLSLGWPPAAWMGDAVANGSVAALAAFIGVSLAVPALALEIMQRNYLRINAASPRTRAAAPSPPASSGTAAGAPLPPSRPSSSRSSAHCWASRPTRSTACSATVHARHRRRAERGRARGHAGLRRHRRGGAQRRRIPRHLGRRGERASLGVRVLRHHVPSARVPSPSRGRTPGCIAAAPLPVRTILGAKLASNALPVAATLAVRPSCCS